MYMRSKRLKRYDTLTPSKQQERKTSQNINVCKKLPQLPGEPQPRTQGLGLCSWRKRTYGTPDGSSEWRRRGGGVVALSKACSASALRVHQIHSPENKGRERVGTSKEGVGRTGKRRVEERGQAEGGWIRVGVKKKSKGEVVGWAGAQHWYKITGNSILRAIPRTVLLYYITAECPYCCLTSCQKW